MIDEETRANIRRLHFNRHLTINAVAEVLGIHHETVRRAISTKRSEIERISMSQLEKYEEKVLETLNIYPKLFASRIYLMLKEQGYKGRQRTVQRWIKDLRPKVKPRVFSTVVVLPGEQAQVDWGHFGFITVGRARRRLSAFVMVLAYSRAIYVRFTLDQTLEALLECHRHAFHFFLGVPRQLLYDNMRTVVSDRIGSKIRFQKDLLDFAGHYLFDVNVCKPFQPESKGRVERSIRYLRENFFAARTVSTIEQLNNDVLQWCKDTALNRPWPEDHSFTVKEKFEAEIPTLLRLPANDLFLRKHKAVKPDAYGYVLFDKNRYSVPAKGFGRSLIMAYDHGNVQILDDKELLVEHLRSWNQGEKIDHPDHNLDREKQLPKPRIASRAASVIERIPALRELLERSIHHDQSNTGSCVRWMEQTLDIHGLSITEKIVLQAVADNILTLDGLRSLLRTELNKAEPDITLALPDKKEVRDLNFRSHSLDSYDQL